MDKAEAKKRIEKLKKEIDYHRYLYHVLDKLDISDAAFDSLKNELEELELKFPELITPDSPSQRVGGEPLDKFKKVEHEVPMLSLNDAFGEEEIRAWEERIKKIIPGARLDYFCELKLDGLAVSLIYEKGVFIQGSTRGNGRIGEDVTQNLKTIQSIPLRLRIPEENELKEIGFNLSQARHIIYQIEQGRIEVRGEAIMTKKVFNELNDKYKKEGKALLANPRNGAAGSIRQLDPRVTAARRLNFYAYVLISDLGQWEHSQEHELMKLLGFPAFSGQARGKEKDFARYCRNLEEVIKFHAYWAEHRERLPFECDGVVVGVNELNLQKKLGVAGKAPRGMQAYKFSGQQATTKVLDIILQVGRTGVLTPVAVLEPVNVGGVTVSRATLHNEDEIKRLGLRIGDTVIVQRAGDVIPDIVEALPKLRTGKEKEFQMPKTCPICGGPVERKEISAGKGKTVGHFCANKNCFAINRRKLMHFVSRQAMDIEGLGPKIVDQLIQEGLIRDPADIYELTEGDLAALERFAEKSAKNLIESIEKSRRVPLTRFISALGILHVGEETAIDLANRFGDIKKISQASLEDLNVIPDIGPVVAQSIYNWFADAKNKKLFERLLNEVKIENPQKKRKAQVFKGMSVVLTGELASFSRDQAKEEIRERGGEVSSSVSKNTDLVVAGESPGSKFDRAKELGVKIVNEEEFLKML